MQELKFLSENEDQTQRLGLAIGDCLQPATILGLSGTLGAGKTRLVQAIAQGLGIEQAIVSPTFSLINSYAGRLNLVHVDLYRVSDQDEFFELGLAEHFDSDAVVVIEWAERFADLLPERTVWINIDVQENCREFHVRQSLSPQTQKFASGRPSDELVPCIASRLQLNV